MTGTGRVPDGDAAARTSAAPPVVLVIDDDPGVLELVCDVLAEAGFPTVTANDGEEGLALALARRPSLIIMDVMMRGVDGYTALTRLRGHPATSDIPVIILTGQEEPIYRTLSHGVGAVAHFTKPFLPTVLTATVRRLLGQPETS
jgi:CheY-like chemotaxis protein